MERGEGKTRAEGGHEGVVEGKVVVTVVRTEIGGEERVVGVEEIVVVGEIIVTAACAGSTEEGWTDGDEVTVGVGVVEIVAFVVFDVIVAHEVVIEGVGGETVIEPTVDLIVVVPQVVVVTVVVADFVVAIVVVAVIVVVAAAVVIVVVAVIVVCYVASVGTVDASAVGSFQ